MTGCLTEISGGAWCIIGLLILLAIQWWNK